MRVVLGAHALEPPERLPVEQLPQVHLLLGEVEVGAGLVRLQSLLDLLDLRRQREGGLLVDDHADGEHADRCRLCLRAPRDRGRRGPARRRCAAARPRSGASLSPAPPHLSARRSPSRAAPRRGGDRRARERARAGPCGGRRAPAGAPSRRCPRRAQARAAAPAASLPLPRLRGRRPRPRRTYPADHLRDLGHVGDLEDAGQRAQLLGQRGQQLVPGVQHLGRALPRKKKHAA